MTTTFVRTSPGIQDPTTEKFSGASSSGITGAAIQVRGDPMRYAALKLSIDTMPTLFFTPTVYGLRANTDDFVIPGDSVVWAGKTFIVKSVDPIAPDGIVIAARIIVEGS